MDVTIKRILVPTDFSDFSKAALAYSEALARSLKAEVVLVHVLERPQDVPWWLAEQEYHARRGALEDEARKRLEELDKTHFPSAEVRRLVRAGSPADEIVEAASEEDADLIVIGTHGRGGLSRVLFGSVAENVMRHADCPVLTVRPEGWTNRA